MKRKIYLALLASLSFVFAFSQNRQVTGRVVRESSSEGLAGVNVSVKGTRITVQTNNSGNYSISVPDRDNLILVFTSVGFKTQEFSLNNKTTADISMGEEA